MPWRAVLEGADAERARAIIARVSAELAALEDLDNLTLNRGWAGIALFQGHLARAGDPEAAHHAYDALARGIALLDTRGDYPWLGIGYLGLAFAMQHLRDECDVDDEALAPMDAFAARLLALDPWPHEYELMAGLIGVGVYALERGRRDLAHRAVAHLERLAVHTTEGITWWNRDPVDWDPSINPNGYHALGIALGLSGAVAYLAETIEAPAAPGLLAGAVDFLTAQERPDVRPRYPMALHADTSKARVRNAWCYGDAAVACVIARAGAAAGRFEWSERARAIATAMADGPIDDGSFCDLSFCCGLIGRGHLFNRLGQSLGDEHLLETARLYYRRALDDAERELPATPGLKNGRAGVALGLLAAVTPVEPSWDRAFLVALPPA